jgi:hypothetical protein
MVIIGIILNFLGFVIAVVGCALILIKAFDKSLGWGLASLFIPLVIFVFVAKNWTDSKKGFFWSLTGAFVLFIGSVLCSITYAPPLDYFGFDR